YFGATMYDLQNDAKPEVLISMGHTINTQPNIIGRRVTKIYRPDSTTNVNDDEIFPMDFNLFQNYPNPFNPITNIRFQINKSETVFIKVYNILGKEIKLVLDKNLLPGEYTIQWDGKDNEGNLLPSGIYFIKVKAG